MMDSLIAGVLLFLFYFSSAEEFCNEHTFQPKCARDEVVIIDRAQYGRMKAGECISEKYGNTGDQCTDDVKARLGALCSGRQTCTVKVTEGLFPGHTSCESELKEYLDAQYSCRKVIRQKEKCTTEPEIVHATEGYISSNVTYETKCGSQSAPWIVRGKPGQRINITLEDFSSINTPGYGLEQGDCMVYATIRDLSKSTASTICGRYTMSQNVVSTRNELEIRILPQSTDKNRPYFLFYFKVFGCEDPIANASQTIERQGANTLKITCLSTGHVTTWTCLDDVWHGPRKNCPTVEPSREKSMSMRVSTMPHALAIVVIVSIAVCVSATILCIGIICLRRTGPRGGYSEATAIPEGAMKMIAIHPGVGAQPQSKIVYHDTEMNTMGRRQARMRQLYAHTAGLHPEKHRSDERGTDRTLDSAHNPFAATHIYESPAEIVRSPLLTSNNQNQARLLVTGNTDLCRICGLTGNSCIHAPLESSDVLPDFQYPQANRTTNNYSV